MATDLSGCDRLVPCQLVPKRPSCAKEENGSQPLLAKAKKGAHLLERPIGYL